MKVWRCSCRVDLFSFFFLSLACGDSGYSQHRFSQRKSAAVSGSFLLDLFTLFSFSLHISCYFLFFPSCFFCHLFSLFTSFSPSAVSLFLHLFPSVPLFCSLIFFLSPSLSFPFCHCPPHTHTLSLSLLSLVFPSSALGTARQTGQ